MWESEQEWANLLCVVPGQMEASILRSRLESEGIPVVLQYESVGSLYGLISNELGEVQVLVPKRFLDPARRLLFPEERIDLSEGEAA
ncbi:MAG: putative signal transducing protein [Nitrospinota bacterium]